MKGLKLLYFTINVVLPLGILAAAVILSNGSDLFKMWTLVGAIPLTAVYWGILFLNFSPHSKWDHFFFLLPVLVALFLAFFNGQTQNLLESWVLQSSMIYAGLNFCFFIGLNHLFLKKGRNAWSNRYKAVAGYLLFNILFIVFMGIPVYFFSSLVFTSHGENFVEMLLFYLLQMLFSLCSFYPKFVQLYREGKL